MLTPFKRCVKYCLRCNQKVFGALRSAQHVGSTNVVSFGQGYLFDRPMADKGSAQGNLFDYSQCFCISVTHFSFHLYFPNYIAFVSSQ